MSVVVASIHIQAPASRVWDLVMDPARLGDWVSIHRKLIRADDGRVQAGYRMDQQIHIRGVSVDVHWTLVKCEPAQLAVWEGRGPARSRARTEYVLREDGDGTQFDYRNEFHAHSARSAPSSAAPSSEASRARGDTNAAKARGPDAARQLTLLVLGEVSRDVTSHHITTSE